MATSFTKMKINWKAANHISDFRVSFQPQPPENRIKKEK
jgi:hypothetical protein